MELFHFDSKIFYGYQLHEPGDVRDFEEHDLANLELRGHRAGACSGDPKKCAAVANGNAPSTVEESNVDPSAARSNDAGDRSSNGNTNFECPGCGKDFSDTTSPEVSLSMHRKSKQH